MKHQLKLLAKNGTFERANILQSLEKKKRKYSDFLLGLQFPESEDGKLVFLTTRAFDHEREGFNVGNEVAVIRHPSDINKSLVLCSLMITRDPRYNNKFTDEELKSQIGEIAYRNFCLHNNGKQTTGRIQKHEYLGIKSNGNEVWKIDFTTEKGDKTAFEIINQQYYEHYFNENGDIRTTYKASRKSFGVWVKYDAPLDYWLKYSDRFEYCTILKHSNGAKDYRTGYSFRGCLIGWLVFAIIVYLIVVFASSGDWLWPLSYFPDFFK